MGRSRKPPEYKPHPLLEELRPPLKASARRSLLKSMERVGQLSEILVTADGYILDGRTRLELAKELNTQPRIRYLSMHSCVGELPPGYDRDWEMEQIRDVIEETGRGKWKDSPARRGGASTNSESNGADTDIGASTNSESNGADTDIGASTNAPPLGLIAATPCDSGIAGIRMPRQLVAHLELMAIKTGSNRKHGKRSTKVTTASVPEYIRRLCWQDFINHLND